MESAQRELVSVLLDHIRSLGLISNSAYSGAVDLVHSVIDFPVSCVLDKGGERT